MFSPESKRLKYYEERKGHREFKTKRPSRAVVCEKEALERMKDFSNGRSNSCHCSNGQEWKCTFLTCLHLTTVITFVSRRFTYAFGGCTVVRGLEGSYLSHAGANTPDRINLIYSDLPLALSTALKVSPGTRTN